jgi:hypothetical protein
MGVSGQRHALAALYLRAAPDYLDYENKSDLLYGQLYLKLLDSDGRRSD